MLKEFEIAGYDMPCVDLAVNVDVFPKPNGGTGINAMSWQGGGKVATGMVAAARLGAKCAMIGAVGSDDYGEFCLRDFERHGIDISGMKTRQGETTSLSIVLSDRETQGRSIVYRSGTANPPTLEEIEERISQAGKESGSQNHRGRRFLLIGNDGEYRHHRRFYCFGILL